MHGSVNNFHISYELPLSKPSQDHLVPAEVSAMVSEVVSEGLCCCLLSLVLMRD